MSGKLRLPRPLHPVAWWIWALAMAAAASRTANPLVLTLLLATVGTVVSARRSTAPWARGFKAYFVVGLVIVGVRVVFRVLLGGVHGEHVLFTLPEVPLPDSVAGIRVGGPVTLEGILAAVYDAMRLATILICVGAANVLADPKRLLKSMPSALHEISVAVVVAISIAPQLAESAQRIRRARKLRGDSQRRMRLFRTVLVPVVLDALDRSLCLAAAMDSRGFGRSAASGDDRRRVTEGLVLLGLLGICVGVYGVLDSTTPWYFGSPMLAAGSAAALVGFVRSGRRVRTTRYRKDPWRVEEWGVCAVAVTVVTVFVVAAATDVDGMFPSVQPLVWPSLPWPAVLGCVVGVLPTWIAPPVRLETRGVAAAGVEAGLAA
ncbi:MAG: energy-coupling factor transporter transmembrane protein EcfT [Acidimicrobiales bacterium]|nr:energy-coupling factor transporter transmembrane protein EcfT [Acidimicrobiales bacterium]